MALRNAGAFYADAFFSHQSGGSKFDVPTPTDDAQYRKLNSDSPMFSAPAGRSVTSVRSFAHKSVFELSQQDRVGPSHYRFHLIQSDKEPGYPGKRSLSTLTRILSYLNPSLPDVSWPICRKQEINWSEGKHDVEILEDGSNFAFLSFAHCSHCSIVLPQWKLRGDSLQQNTFLIR